MATNPGLSSRFAEKVIFNPINAKMSCQLLLNGLKSKDVAVDEFSMIESKIETIFEDLITKTNGWGNGRDINTIVENMMRSIAKSRVNMKVTAGEDIDISMKSFYHS